LPSLLRRPPPSCSARASSRLPRARTASPFARACAAMAVGWTPLDEQLAGLQGLDTLTASIVVATSAVFLALLLRRKPDPPSTGSNKTAGGTSPVETSSLAGSTPAGSRSGGDLGFDSGDPCLEGTIFPSTGLLRANCEPVEFENDNCTGFFVTIHRPTLNKALDKSAEYPYGDHMKGRKRLWELRLQVKFKEPVNDSLLIGIELEEYVPLNSAAQKLMALTVAALRRVAGNDLYHSIGDDPSKGSGPHEKPVFMMPLWACDQIVVTPEGEKAPSLNDPQFCNYGELRTADRKAFIKTASDLEFQPGPTYTFSIWGISQFLDCIKWEVQKVIPFKSIDFNVFCGNPPVQIVFYTLRPPSTKGDNRHLQSRKNYYFRFALWSSEKRPSASKMRELIPSANMVASLAAAAAHDVRAACRKTGLLASTFGCCTGSR